MSTSNEGFGNFGPGRATLPDYASELAIEPTDPLIIPHDMLARAVAMAVTFNEDERPHRGEYFRRQFADFEQAVSGVPGYQGVFGTGYPFYAWKPDGGVYAIEEISIHTESYQQWIRNDRVRNLGKWPCAACQRDRQLPDLKQQCKPCDLVSFKPRDLFKVIPDVDFWVIVDDANPDILQQIEASVRNVGFYTSDESIKPALYDAVSVMQHLQNGAMPKTRLPVDMHVVTTAEISQCIGQVMEELGRDDEPGFIPISPRSLRARWEQNDLPYDFLKDFLFSFTTKGWRDVTLARQLADTREQARAIIKGDAVSRVSALSEIAARQLRTSEIQIVLEDRIAEW